MQHDYINMLINAAKQGRKNSFLDLCEFNLKKIYNFCLRMVADKKLAEVITEEVFNQAWNSIKSVRDDVPFELWLRGIALVTSLDEIRTKRRQNELNISSKSIEESKDKYENFLLKLDDKERIIFLLHEIEGYKHNEISDVLYEYSFDEIKSTNIATREKLLKEFADEL